MADAQNSARLIDRWAGGLLARYIRFVRRTSSNVEEMDEIVADSIKHHPCIVAMWHGEFMLLPLIKPPNHPTDIMLARHTDAAFLGEALKQFDMQLIRGAGAAGRGKDRGGSHAYRSAIQALRDGRAVGMTADVPGGKARHAGLGIVMAAKQSGKPILPVAIATKRYVALNSWSRMTINLPYSRLGFAVGPLVHVPREATTEELEGYRQAVEDGLNMATEKAYARAGSDPTRATPGAPRAGTIEPGRRLKAYRTLTSLARPVAPFLLGLRARRGKEEPLRRHERLGQPSVPRPAGRLAWFHAASVGETNAILPLMSALAEARPSLSFLLTTGTVTSAKLAAQRLGPRAIHQYAPLDAPEYAARLSRPLAAGPCRLHRVGDLAQPDPGKLGARHSSRSHQRPHDQALVPPLAAQSGRRASAVQPVRLGAGTERRLGPPLCRARRAERNSRRQSQGRLAAAAGRWRHAGAAAARARRPRAADRNQHARRRGRHHRRCPPCAGGEPSQPVHHHRAPPSRARRGDRRDAERSRLQGGAALPRRPARPHQRRLRRRHHR